ncbi:MAG: hypothetical protein ACRDZQ_09710, partial [Acidimicrobiales bacterium]
MPFAYLDLVDEITAPMPPMPVARLGLPPWTPLSGPLDGATVIILSSAGVHLSGERPFDPTNDLSFRRLPQDVDPGRLVVSHPSPIRRPGRMDVNVVHPYQRLGELAAEGWIGGVAPYHLSMLGAIKLLVPLVSDVAPALAAAAREAGSQVVLVAPLCPACHQTMGLLARALEGEGLVTV